MNKCNKNNIWINTEVNFTWDGELQQLVEVSSEGYCYDGEVELLDCGAGGGLLGSGCADGGGSTGGGGVSSQFSYYHQPDDVQHAQFPNGYVVNNDLIIPDGFGYKLKRNGWISMVYY